MSNLYKLLFWAGYIAVLSSSLININNNLDSIKVNAIVFELRGDYLAHFSVYLLICLYFLYGLKKGYPLFQNNSLIKFFISVIFLATVTEIIQLWVPSRTFNVFDLLANILGVAIGGVIVKGTGDW